MCGSVLPVCMPSLCSTPPSAHLSCPASPLPSVPPPARLLACARQTRKALASLREDEDVRVFLLSHRAGAAGLTLVRANHVYLLDPAMDPAIEQQAVARVHRIGQQRCVAWVCRVCTCG